MNTELIPRHHQFVWLFLQLSPCVCSLLMPDGSERKEELFIDTIMTVVAAEGDLQGNSLRKQIAGNYFKILIARAYSQLSHLPTISGTSAAQQLFSLISCLCKRFLMSSQ